MAQNVKLKNISFEDNPNRNSDGTFASSGGDQTGGGTNTGGRKLSDIRNEYANIALNELKDEIKEKQKDVKKDAGFHNVEALEDLEAKLKEYEKIQKVLDEMPNLFDWDAQGEQKQKAGTKGYKNGQSKSAVKVEKKSFNVKIIDRWTDADDQGIKNKFPKFPRRLKEERKQGEHEGVKRKQFNDVFHGQTIISDSEMLNSEDPHIKEMMDTIFDTWNNIFDDEMRSGVDILNIRDGTAKDFDARKGIALGSMGDREWLDFSKHHDGDHGEDPLIAPSAMGFLITKDMTKLEVVELMIHEGNHKIWNDMSRDKPEKIKAFVDKVFELGRDGAPTDYAESYWNAYNKVLMNPESTKDDIEKAKILIANEYHSEFTSSVAVPFSNDYWTLRLESIEKANELVQELHSE
jgi:hypothetical protein